MKRILYNTLILASAALFLHSCEKLPDSALHTSQISIDIDIAEKALGKGSSGARLTAPETVIITVTAPDIDPPIVTSAGIAGRRASVNLEVPQGESRTFTLEITGPLGFIWYTGSRTIDLNESQITFGIQVENGWFDTGNSSVDPAQITNLVWAKAPDAAFVEEILLPPNEEVYFWGLAFYMGAAPINRAEYEVAAYTGDVLTTGLRQIVTGNPQLFEEQWNTIPIDWSNEDIALISEKIYIGLIYKSDLEQPKIGYEPKNSANTWFFSPSQNGWLNVANDISSIEPGALAVRALFLRRSIDDGRKSLIAVSPDGEIEKWPFPADQTMTAPLQQVR